MKELVGFWSLLILAGYFVIELWAGLAHWTIQRLFRDEIALKFDPVGPAPNIGPSWNVCPTDPMLVAVRSADGRRFTRGSCR
jgi:hypothetical protein